MSDFDPNVMPDVHEGILDADAVRRLLGDVDACATLESITVKHAATQHVNPQPTSLGEAATQLFTGSARAIQLRYEHRGTHWTDTVLQHGSGYRLIRIAQHDGSGVT